MGCVVVAASIDSPRMVGMDGPMDRWTDRPTDTPSTDSFADLRIGDAIIEYVSRYRYLGFNVILGVKFKFSTTECLRSFFG